MTLLAECKITYLIFDLQERPQRGSGLLNEVFFW